MLALQITSNYFWQWLKKLFRIPSIFRSVFSSIALSLQALTEVDDDEEMAIDPSPPEAPETNLNLRYAIEILPPELWQKILRYGLRLTGAHAIAPKDPFDSQYDQEDYPHIHPGYFEDRRSCRRVCRLFNTFVKEIMVEYIVIHHHSELDFYVSLLETESIMVYDRKPLGERTTRIDFCITGQNTYEPDMMFRLLTVVPNLLIYTTNTGNNEQPEYSMNQTILYALVNFHSSALLRLDWSGVNDAPTYSDLHLISKNLTSLQTLHMRHLYSLPPTTTTAPLLNFPSLQSLSLGLIPFDRPPDITAEFFPYVWDVFLLYLTAHQTQLSKINQISIYTCPTSTNFFQMHGHKIKTFQTTSWSAYLSLEPAFDLLPNLQTFNYIFHTDPQPYIPLTHPTLNRIALLPMIENYIEVPFKFYHSCILRPIDNIFRNVDAMTCSKLRELRICDNGAYTGIFEKNAHLFWSWRKCLESKKIRVENQYGDLDKRYAQYGDECPPQPQNFPVRTDLPASSQTNLPSTSSTEPGLDSPTLNSIITASL